MDDGNSFGLRHVHSGWTEGGRDWPLRIGATVDTYLQASWRWRLGTCYLEPRQASEGGEVVLQTFSDIDGQNGLGRREGLINDGLKRGVFFYYNY